MEAPTNVSLPEPPPPRVRDRTVFPVAVLLVVIALVAFGGYAVAGALSEPSGAVVEVGGAVRVFPLSGWELAERFAEPPGARLVRGSGNLDVAVLSFAGSREDLLRRYVDQVLDPDAEQLSVSDVEVVSLRSGLEGSRLAYVGTFGDVQAPIEGQLTAVVSPAGVGLIFDGWAPAGLLQFVLGDIEAMIERAEVT